MKIVYRLLACCFVWVAMENAYAQDGQATFRYLPAQQLTLVGKPLPAGPFFHRVDTAAYPDIPQTVKNLLTHSAGLALSFSTNSSQVAVRWCTSPGKPGDNLTAIAQEGLDLYIKRDGRWQFAGVARLETHECNEYVMVQNMAEGDKECLLYLPLYDETLSLEVGVEAGASLASAPNPFRYDVLVYGSSIVQGASASRPGLAYPARLSRETGLNVFNLGVSGNARMEPAVAAMIGTMPMDAFILDCVPNSSPEEVTERTANLVNTIRSLHPDAPIIAIQGIIRENANFDRSIADKVKRQNDNFLREISHLQQSDSHLYLITADGLLGYDNEGTTDGTHPNDLGFDRMLQKIRPAVEGILGKYGR